MVIAEVFRCRSGFGSLLQHTNTAMEITSTENNAHSQSCEGLL